MRLADFDYDLPPERIAQTPIEPRDSARLLIDRGSEAPIDGHVSDLLGELNAGDLLVLNDTKVLPARIRLRRETGGKAEVLLLDPLDGLRRHWNALVRPGKKLKVGEVLFASGRGAASSTANLSESTGQPLRGGGVTGANASPGADEPTSADEPTRVDQAVVRIGERSDAGDTFRVELLGPTDELGVLEEFGEMPLPPYIEERLDDPARYQTVYAREPGSAAAPTAGLHFTPTLLERLQRKGVKIAWVELVVGLDTFRPIDVEDPLDHRMHTERYRVPAATQMACATTRAGGGRVVAVGTTSVRALESAATFGELEGRTRLFIHRGYEWKTVDVMMTNFHMPRTTLLMMIDAFVGDRWRSLYDHALVSKDLDPIYRFLSFGDAMLLDRTR